MKANPYSLLQIFSPDIQYVVPIFQRRYVWNREDQWEELWEDLVNTIHDVERVEALKEQGASDPIPSHFMGAIVCDQSISGGADIDKRPLIDGQQRLTTLQVLLARGLHAARAVGDDAATDFFDELVKNNKHLIDSEEEGFKIWPSGDDREAFATAVEHENPSRELSHLITELADFFDEKISEWAKEGDAATQLVRLAKTLRRHVELVVIDLQAGDNAQVIFESLNYGGRELTAMDLVKNFVFLRAQQEGLDPHDMHRDQWSNFESDWWNEVVSQGRYRRERAELFLMHWLKLERLDDVRAHRLFVDFRDLATGADLQEIVTRLANDRDLYRTAQESPSSLPVDVGGFFERLDLIDQSTPLPVAMQLLRAVPDKLDPERASRALHAIDSFIWRRAIVTNSTANYNRIFLELLKAIDADISRADELVVERLSQYEGDSNWWPTDKDLAERLSVRGVYGTGAKATNVVSTVLRMTENDWRRPRGESALGPDNDLQIEHMLPQEWTKYWPLQGVPDSSLQERTDNRNAHLHLIGNLTLVSPSMNQSMSNKAWAEKRGLLREHSNVLITQRFLELADWDETQIRDRTGKLVDALAEVWPGPDGSFSEPPAI